MVVIKVIAKNPFQVSLIQDDDVIQTFSADRSNNAFDIGILPKIRVIVFRLNSHLKADARESQNLHSLTRLDVRTSS